MLTALKEIIDLNSLAFLENYQDCPECQKTGWVPSPNGRRCLHRHDELTLRVIPHLGVLLRDFCKDFKTDNDGLIHLLLRGLQAEGVLPGASQVVADSQQLNNQEPIPIETKEETQEEETNKGPDLWAPLAEPLKERVSEQNFEVWLSSIRFFSSDESRLVLHVPNTFFQEYLAEHYTEVIEEELHKTGSPQKVFFEVGPMPQEAITTLPKEPAPQVKEEEVVLPPLSPKEEIRIRRRLQAREEATSRKSGLNHRLLASLLTVIEAAEAEEDRREQEQRKAAFKEARRDQWARPSSWWSDDKASNKKIRQLAEQLDRDEKRGTNKPKRE